MNSVLLNTCSLLLLLSTIGISNAVETSSQGLADPTPEMVQRSLLSMGDTSRLINVILKAKKGEKIVIGAIGGSITAGAGASTVETRWANRAAKWWMNRFPNTHVEFINAGIGATGSNIGAHRIQNDLLKYKPDLVMVEFAVNDANNKLAAETMEGLTRQILKMPNKPAVIYVFTTHPDGSNAQEWHSKIGYHYKIPMISFRDAIYPEFQSGRVKWQDLLPDGIHPNDQGHKYISDFIAAMLDSVYASSKDIVKPRPIKRLPKPLTSDVFEHTRMYTADSINPLSNIGWNIADGWRGAKYWESYTPGSTITFEVEGTAISITYYRIKGSMGMAEAQVDDRPPVKMNAWFEADWGGYSEWALIARDLQPGKHTLKITLLHEKHPESNGHHFQLLSIMEAGLYK